MYEEYTDKQIVEMLKPKLEKLGWGNVVNDDLYPDTCKMIASIYRSAYIRGQLGRNFIIGEKKPMQEPVFWLKAPDHFLKKIEERWIPATPVNIKKGDKVRMVDKDAHNSDPLCFPIAGTIGTVIGHDFYDVYVQWPKGTTSSDDRWYSYYNRLEVLVCE